MPNTPAAARILVADDEATIRSLLEKYFERLGFEVLSAADGDEAIDLLAEHGERIDLVLLDLMMPGSSGVEVLREIRRTQPDLAVLVTSGYDQGFLRAEVEAVGVQGFLGKPFSLRELGETIRATLAAAAD